MCCGYTGECPCFLGTTHWFRGNTVLCLQCLQLISQMTQKNCIDGRIKWQR